LDKSKTISLFTHIGVVRFGLVYLGEYANDRFGKLIDFNVPLLEQVDSIFGFETTYVEKYSVCAQFLVN
jgi:hypothetical protein